MPVQAGGLRRCASVRLWMQAPLLLLGLVSLHVHAHGELLQNFSLFRLLIGDRWSANLCSAAALCKLLVTTDAF